MPSKLFLPQVLAITSSLITLLPGCQKEISRPEMVGVEHLNFGVTNAAITAANNPVCDYNMDETQLTRNGWTKVFEDQFETDLSKWNIWRGGAYNNELQHYQGENLLLGNSLLSIAAKRESVAGATLPSDPTPKSFSYTSGRIESKTHFSASTATPKVRMVARIKLATGYGMWPAFWSYGDPWPTQGEIDILEARGQEPFKYHSAYWYGRRAGLNQAANTEGTITSSVSLTDCFHVYEMIWEKNTLTFLFDGQVVEVKSGGYIPSMFRKSQRVTLNLAVGGGFFNPFDPALVQTGTMHVDWVKVFTAK